MLKASELTSSLRQGVIRLLPNIAGVPNVAQLCPITLHCIDYKLLTKMLMARLLVILLSFLRSAQLCSV